MKREFDMIYKSDIDIKCILVVVIKDCEFWSSSTQ